MTTQTFALRRRLLRHASQLGTAAAATALPLLCLPARADTRGEQRLRLAHTHTGEQLDIVYAVDGHYRTPALATLDRFLRDHYSGDVAPIDPRLFDLLHHAQRALGHGGSFEIVSGYRCPSTNARLRQTGGGGVARHSLHMEGRALDVRLPGVALADLRDAALEARGGGVGFYAREKFVHIDTGRVRRW
jgi:uncharacterized protein YcbK (DUF882 family)